MPEGEGLFLYQKTAENTGVLCVSNQEDRDVKKIAILGSTGSIGTQTLQVAEENGDLQVTALAAGKNVRRMEEQIRKFRPKLACTGDEKKAKELQLSIRDLDVKVTAGMEGLMEVAAHP